MNQPRAKIPQIKEQLHENKIPKPVSIKIEQELHKCPNCGYEDGFHTSFVRTAEETCKIILICPGCHARYDPDWTVEV
ncbi:MAG: hypothetical protein CV087_19905 [Candidatus Brocadia sp. WS118]|nr:MAG: hypothetical protein CV087_19905 [Candidatus Brocadia sp. WS118]